MAHWLSYLDLGLLPMTLQRRPAGRVPIAIDQRPGPLLRTWGSPCVTGRSRRGHVAWVVRMRRGQNEARTTSTVVAQRSSILTPTVGSS